MAFFLGAFVGGLITTRFVSWLLFCLLKPVVRNKTATIVISIVLTLLLSIVFVALGPNAAMLPTLVGIYLACILVWLGFDLYLAKRSAWEPHPLAVLIWIITLGSVWMFTNKRWWFPEAISEHGPAVDHQFMITIIVVGVAFAAAQIGLGWAVWKYRDSASAQRATYSHGNNRLEVIWTIVTAVVFISLAVMGQRVWASLHLHSAPPGSYQIEVVAQQFAWTFRYPGKDGVFGRTDPSLINDEGQNFVGLDETAPNAKDDIQVSTLVIPAHQPVELILRSKDVTHSFFVPQLRFKQDLVPGMKIPVHFTANKVGKYELACAELCGMNHYKMKSYMLVLPREEFTELVSLPPAQFLTRKDQLMSKYQLPQY